MERRYNRELVHAILQMVWDGWLYKDIIQKFGVNSTCMKEMARQDYGRIPNYCTPWVREFFKMKRGTKEPRITKRQKDLARARRLRGLPHAKIVMICDLLIEGWTDASISKKVGCSDWLVSVIHRKKRYADILNARCRQRHRRLPRPIVWVPAPPARQQVCSILFDARWGIDSKNLLVAATLLVC